MVSGSRSNRFNRCSGYGNNDHHQIYLREAPKGAFLQVKMRLINEYTPPTPEDLERLKSDLGFTGTQMADLAGVASNSQWRKYTGGAEPRAMSPHILFFMAAQLVLSEDELNNILEKMHEIGARIS